MMSNSIRKNLGDNAPNNDSFDNQKLDLTKTKSTSSQESGIDLTRFGIQQDQQNEESNKNLDQYKAIKILNQGT